MTHVQILVDDEGNRNALAALLDRRFSVETTPEFVDAELYLVDDRTLPAYRDDLFEHKRDAHPTFCPVVLIQRRDTHVNVRLTDPAADSAHDFQLIDDTISAPVDRTVLFQRMENLLARRKQSIQLSRRYERTQARFEGLFQTIPDPGFVVDDERTLTEVNEAFCTLAALDREELLGRDPLELELFEETDVERFRLASGETGARDEASTVRDEILTVRHQGRQRHLEVRYRTEYVDDDANTVVVMHDVTDLKETNEQLEEFASIVTHDLRNPMNVVLARGAILETKLPDDPEYEAELERIEDAVERMDELIDDVGTLVRETDVTETESVSLEAVAHDAWRNVDTADATLRFPGGDVDVVAQRRRLLQLFENLLRNACEHGGDDVTVEVGRLDEGFYVADDGPGIPPSRRDEVLESGVTTGNGSGLGLKIVAEIAAAHEWELTVSESETGGARFELWRVESPSSD